MLIYDVTNRKSFEDLSNWINEIDLYYDNFLIYSYAQP